MSYGRRARDASDPNRFRQWYVGEELTSITLEPLALPPGADLTGLEIWLAPPSSKLPLVDLRTP